MICRGCSQESHHVRTIVDKNGEFYDICANANCGQLSSMDAYVPDVYLKSSGQKFANLCDEMGRPYEISSKRHKKEVMDKLGVSEAGDTVNGAPYGSKTWVEGSRDYRRKQFERDRPMIRETYQRYLDNVRKKR